MQKDLDESRGLLQRLLTIEDALTGTTVTVVAALLGLAFANKRAAIAWLLVPIVAIMAYLAARVAVQWRRVTTRIGALEQIVNAYASVLRESGTARPKAIQRLDRHLARYSFGAQGTLDRVSFNDLKRANKKRLRWWLLPAIGGVVVACGAILTTENADDASKDDVCVRVSPTDVVRLDKPPVVASGTLIVVACDLAQTTITLPPITTAPSGPTTT